MSALPPFDPASQILLIDDDAHLRLALSQTLDLAGFKVTTLADARDLEMATVRDWPGVVVSDIRMPGIDGLELLAQLHQRDAELPERPRSRPRSRESTSGNLGWIVGAGLLLVLAVWWFLYQ